jgi:DNA-binding transcriptional LysR family regulator
MDFEQLRIFLVLAEEGTYLGAANRLSTSRSRVRRKLDQLEDAANTPLVYREQGSLRLTPAGEVLARRGRALLDDAERLVSHVREVGNIPTGRLKIAMPTGPPPAGWGRIRRKLQTRFPELQIELFFAESPTELLSGRAEIALTYDDEMPQGCHSIEIGEFPMRLFVSDRYTDSHGSPTSLADLALHRIAMWRSADRPYGFLPLKGGGGLRLSPKFVTAEPSLLYRMAIEGDFIVYLPELPALTDPSLKILFADEVVGTVRERLAIPDILADLPRIQQFVELTERTIAPITPITQ